MIEAFGTLVGIMFFIGALIFTVFDRAANVYSDYSSEKRKYEWEIEAARIHGNETERIKYEYMLNRLASEYFPEVKITIVIYSIVIIILFVVMIVIGSSLAVFAQIPQANENNSSSGSQNITYSMNNYIINTTNEQITIRNENRVVSIKDLNDLINNRERVHQICIP